jgi:hypothetical protein
MHYVNVATIFIQVSVLDFVESIMHNHMTIVTEMNCYQ